MNTNTTHSSHSSRFRGWFQRRLVLVSLCLFLGWALLCCASEGNIQLKVIPASGQKFPDAKRVTLELKGEGLDKSPIKSEFSFGDGNAKVPSFAIQQETDKPWFDVTARVYNDADTLIGFGQVRLPFVSKTLDRGILVSRVNAFGWVTEIADGAQSLLSSSVVGHKAVTLNNGKILIVGGAIEFQGNRGVYQVTQKGFMLNALFLYDPKTGLIEKSNSQLANPRVFHTVSVMGNGLVVIAGGMGFIDGNLEVLGTVEIYDPGNDTIRGSNSMKEPRAFHTATRIGDSELVMVGGLSKPLKAGGNALEQGQQVLKVENYFVGSAASNGRISGHLAYPPTQNGCNAPSSDVLSEVDGRWLHQTVRLSDNLLLVTGGLRVDKDGKRDVPKHAIKLTRNGECWRPLKAEKENFIYPRYEHKATVLELEGQRWAVISGGRDANNRVVGPIEIWSPTGTPVGNAGKLALARFGHSAIAIPGGKILILGGLGSNHNFLAKSEFYKLDLSGGARLLPVPTTSPDSYNLNEQNGRFYAGVALSPNAPRVLVFGGGFRSQVTDLEKEKNKVWTFRGQRSAEFFTHEPTLDKK